MSVLDSRRYGRRSTTSFTREEFMKIINTPPADLTEIQAEAARINAEMKRLQALEDAGIKE